MDGFASQVERMLSERCSFAVIEDRIDGMAASDDQKAALWLLAWSGQAERVRRRTVVEALKHAAQPGWPGSIGSLHEQVDTAESAP